MKLKNDPIYLWLKITRNRNGQKIFCLLTQNFWSVTEHLLKIKIKWGKDKDTAAGWVIKDHGFESCDSNVVSNLNTLTLILETMAMDQGRLYSKIIIIQRSINLW